MSRHRLRIQYFDNPDLNVDKVEEGDFMEAAERLLQAHPHLGSETFYRNSTRFIISDHKQSWHFERLDEAVA